MTGSSNPADRLLGEATALRALARRLVADDGDDVVQDAYVAALRDGIDGEPTGRWLTAVTRRLALLRRRRDDRRRQRETRAARADATASAADVAATTELMRRVATAVHELDEPFRTAITLRFWHGLPPRAIAARTGVPVNTVRSAARIWAGELLRRDHREADARPLLAEILRTEEVVPGELNANRAGVAFARKMGFAEAYSGTPPRLWLDLYVRLTAWLIVPPPLTRDQVRELVDK